MLGVKMIKILNCNNIDNGEISIKKKSFKYKIYI